MFVNQLASADAAHGVPHCLAPEPPFPLVVVLPLDDDSPDAAAAALAARLESWERAPPCDDGQRLPVRPPTLIVAWSGAAAAQTAAASAAISALLEQRVRPVRHCFGAVELLGHDAIRALVPQMPFGSGSPESCGEEGVTIKLAGLYAANGPAGSIGAMGAVGGSGPTWGLVPTQGTVDEGARSAAAAGAGTAVVAPSADAAASLSEAEAFLAMLTHARGLDGALLWMPRGTHALRPGWLQGLLCQVASERAAWIIGSPQLMDCERSGGWSPAPACCEPGPRVSTHHLGPAAVYLARSRDFYEYAMEYHSGRLFAPRAGEVRHPFYTALSAVQWLTYHESRQRKLLHRWVATGAIHDFGAQQMSLVEAAATFRDALLLYTTNSSVPAEGAPRPPPKQP